MDIPPNGFLAGTASPVVPLGLLSPKLIFFLGPSTNSSSSSPPSSSSPAGRLVADDRSVTDVSGDKHWRRWDKETCENSDAAGTKHVHNIRTK